MYFKQNNKLFYLAIILLYAVFIGSCNNANSNNTNENVDNTSTFEVWSDTIIKEKYENGKIRLIWGYKPNERKMHYVWNYYRNGNMWFEGPMLDTLRHGKWIGYNELGAVVAKGTYNLGKATGIYTVWHDNGAKFYEGEMLDGQRIGEWTFYDENSKIQKVIDYSKKESVE